MIRISINFSDESSTLAYGEAPYDRMVEAAKQAAQKEAGSPVLRCGRAVAQFEVTVNRDIAFLFRKVEVHNDDPTK